MKVGRREHFNAAHRLFREEWSEDKNFEIFGKCANPNYHGHNYVIETWVEGPISEVTGYVVDLKHLKDIVKQEVCYRFDHRNLNLDVPEFTNLIPTAENIAVVSWRLIKAKLPAHLKLVVRLHETENNVVEYDGSEER